MKICHRGTETPRMKGTNVDGEEVKNVLAPYLSCACDSAPAPDQTMLLMNTAKAFFPGIVYSVSLCLCG